MSGREKPVIREVILVEGRYDKNALSQVVDATIVTTEGFGVFQDRQRLAFFRRLAAERGLIVLTDSDGAGFVIRNFLKSAIPAAQLKQAYVPDIYGKERRKRRAGKEGKLGVEGMSPEILLRALRDAGATIDGTDTAPKRDKISKQDLFALGLSGGQDSARRRSALIRSLQLPEHMSANALLDALNVLMDRARLEAHCAALFGAAEASGAPPAAPADSFESQ